MKMLNNSLLIALSSPNVSCILGENILLLFYSLPSNYFYSWQSKALRKTSANSCICCSLYFLAFLESCTSCIKFPISAFPHWLSFLSPTNQKEIILWKNYKNISRVVPCKHFIIHCLDICHLISFSYFLSYSQSSNLYPELKSNKQKKPMIAW